LAGDYLCLCHGRGVAKQTVIKRRRGNG
jgi:hypothetical protein